MKKIVSIISLILIMALSRGFAADAAAPAADDSAIDAKAKELLTGKNTRIDKISTVHSFVRDEIGQAKTQYG